MCSPLFSSGELVGYEEHSIYGYGISGARGSRQKLTHVQSSAKTLKGASIGLGERHHGDLSPFSLTVNMEQHRSRAALPSQRGL